MNSVTRSVATLSAAIYVRKLPMFTFDLPFHSFATFQMRLNNCSLPDYLVERHN